MRVNQQSIYVTATTSTTTTFTTTVTESFQDTFDECVNCLVAFALNSESSIGTYLWGYEGCVLLRLLSLLLRLSRLLVKVERGVEDESGAGRRESVNRQQHIQHIFPSLSLILNFPLPHIQAYKQ